ncbi:MAG: histidine kinase N-terminal 7TM domain-containing protein [Bacteroidales bacterium]|nr:histidine kinase N-terminal 7TM domain-containing protein [Bacteroidales bacterium]
MTQHYTIYSMMYLITALVSFFGVVLAWNKKEIKGAKELAWLMFASGFGAFWIIFSTSAMTVAEKVFWAKMEYVGGVFTPAIFLMFILRFTERDRYLKTKYIILYLLPFLVTLCLLWLNKTDHLVWSGFSAIYPETNLMEFYHGPVFWLVYVLFSYLMMGLGSVLILIFLIKHKGRYRQQGIVILIGSLIPWTSSIFYIAGINIAPGLDLAPASIAISGIILIYAISYTKLLNLVPVAREALVENIPDGILALDKQERILDINKAALNLLGIENCKVHGLSIFSVGAATTPLLDALIDSNEYNRIAIDINGKNFIFQITKKPLKNTPGSRLIIINDITDLILKEREVVNAEERYYRLYSLFRLMADNMPDLLWAKDLKKRYIFVNKTMCDTILLAKDTDEPIGKTYSYFLERSNKEHPGVEMWNTIDDQTRYSDMDVLESEKPVHYILKGYFNGVYSLLDIRKSPIFDDNGTMIGLVGIGRDVTLQKKNEEELIKAKEMAEQSERLKTSFLANMSHEIRTPMNGIIGFTELLKEPKLSGEEQQEYIRVIEKSGERLLNIINDIIKISKLESDLVQPMITELYINELLDYMYHFFLPQTQAKNIELIIVNPLKDENPAINSDKEKLYAILTNLTRNAIKFTDKGFIEIGYSHTDNEYTFYVKDSGIGMTPDQIEIVFERFRQGSETIARDYEGSGLGLSISKAYVEMLDGKIWVESEIDKGSVFYFTIKG